MLSQIMWLIGASIFLVLGTLHLVYTFFTKKFLARDAHTVELMKATYPLISKQTTMWKAWIGFNASHSYGAIFFGLINIILATFYYVAFDGSFIIPLLNIITCLSYLVIAVKYWFRVPMLGILIASCCFILSFILDQLHY